MKGELVKDLESGLEPNTLQRGKGRGAVEVEAQEGGVSGEEGLDSAAKRGSEQAVGTRGR